MANLFSGWRAAAGLGEAVRGAREPMVEERLVSAPPRPTLAEALLRRNIVHGVVLRVYMVVVVLSGWVRLH